MSDVDDLDFEESEAAVGADESVGAEMVDAGVVEELAEGAFAAERAVLIETASAVEVAFARLVWGRARARGVTADQVLAFGLPLPQDSSSFCSGQT